MHQPTVSPLRAVDKCYYHPEANEDLPYNTNKRKDYGTLLNSKDLRTVFQHDRDAIIYSKSFRRLMHKTQVTYPGAGKNEHTRTRMTHTLEVVEIARALAYSLGLNEDLAEAIALGHDIGHTPFGHEGEEFLNNVCHGSEIRETNQHSIRDTYNLPEFSFDFKHNYQSVRVLLYWEGRHYDDDLMRSVPGLNISKQTLEGILKHSKIYKDAEKKTCYRYPEILEDKRGFFMLDKPYSVWSVEGQLVAVADEIAQVCHDLEDAISADYSVKHHLYQEITHFINHPSNIDIYETFVGQVFIHDKDTGKLKIDKNEFPAFISWIVGYLINLTKEKVSTRMRDYIAGKDKFKRNYFPLDCELASETLTLESDKIYSFLKRLQSIYIINNVRINRENGKADFILKSIIEAYLNKPKQLPDSVLERYAADEKISKYIKEKLDAYLADGPDDIKPNVRYIFGKKQSEENLRILKELRNDQVFLRIFWDYMASMTDQYALNEYKMLYLGDEAYRSSI